MRILMLTSTGLWERMTCDTCGENLWEIVERYLLETSQSGKEETKFRCQMCGALGPILRKSQWKE